MTDWLSALEAATWVAALRDSVWAYPLVNAAHLLGVALLVGAIVPLDLRLLGFWPAVPVSGLGRVLRGVAATGLLLALLAGGLLFATRASEYAASPFFLAKMGFVCLGGINALVASRTSPEYLAGAGRRGVLVALVSLICWVTALILGRLVGYF